MKKFLMIVFLVILSSLAFAYNIGSGDIINITSPRNTELNSDYIVDHDGCITVQYAGRIKVQGKTVEEITDIIRKALSERINSPEIYISLKDSKNSVVFVTGMVKAPGSVNINANSNIATVIAQVGDVMLNEKSSISEDDLMFTVKSLDGTITEIKYNDLLKSNYILRNGDIINADIAGKINVSVMGKVNTPGRYQLSSKNSSVMGAIITAGGFADEADYSQVKVYDYQGNGQIADLSELISSNNGKSDIEITQDCTIIVPQIIESVTCIGWVNKQGKQIYQPNETITLADVIANAGGGVRNRARYNEVYVLRTVNGELTKTAYNFNNFQKKGDITGNPIIKRGDVVFMPSSQAWDWETILSVLRNVINVSRDVKEL